VDAGRRKEEEKGVNHSLFREGGPYNIRRIRPEKHSLSIPIPTDEYGRIARTCPSGTCSPGYFRVKPGTGLLEGVERSYCPYCRYASSPEEFATEEQIRYAKDIAMREAEKGVDQLVKDTLGLNASGKKTYDSGFVSLEWSYKPGPRRPVHRPVEEELQRVVVCPHCGLDHAVFGMAIWCPDCGKDIFMAHVTAEFTVVLTILLDVERRHNEFGPRVAAKDLENCLEDTVSIFEAAAKAIVMRYLRSNGKSEQDVQAFLKRIVKTSFQSIDRTTALLQEHFHLDLSQHIGQELLQGLRETFEKRHPITHNLGVIDRKYLERALTEDTEGREVRVNEEEVRVAVERAGKVLEILHDQLISSGFSR